MILAAEVLCVTHVVRTGRPFWWIYLIVFAPLVGTIVYLGVEILPGLYRGPTARQVASRVVRVFDPYRGVREAWRRLELSPTVQNKTALAQEYLAAGQPQDAVALYRDVLSGIHATDPALMLGLARALFALGDTAEVLVVLDRLREANPDYSSPEGHLLYARSLEMEGRTAEALYEYAALTAYYPGQEARCRYALLLVQAGHTQQAKQLFTEVVRAVDKAGGPFKRAQREWYDIAKQNLA